MYVVAFFNIIIQNVNDHEIGCTVLGVIIITIHMCPEAVFFVTKKSKNFVSENK